LGVGAREFDLSFDKTLFIVYFVICQNTTGDASMLIVTELHYHRNGCFGAGYYAAKATWRVDGEHYDVMAVIFDQEEHIAILGANDISTSFRYEDFATDLRKFVTSRGGQTMAFPHTILQAQ
jgi:hypothetical protein